MRRYVPLLIAGAALVSAACSDVTTAPTSNSGYSRVTPQVSSALPGTKVFSQIFTIPAAGGVVRVGDFKLWFPPNAVCDPETSGYGPGTWDTPCETLNTDYTLNAEYYWENHEAFVDFFAQIRFDPSKVVWISVVRPGLIDESFLQQDISYWYLTQFGKVKQSEGIPSYMNSFTGELFRRVKHFTGYSASSGAPCDDTIGDPDCIPLHFDFDP